VDLYTTSIACPVNTHAISDRCDMRRSREIDLALTFRSIGFDPALCRWEPVVMSPEAYWPPGDRNGWDFAKGADCDSTGAYSESFR
jgi:hypothetical protein